MSCARGPRRRTPPWRRAARPSRTRRRCRARRGALRPPRETWCCRRRGAARRLHSAPADIW
eukprot:14844330-Alexandrium_andersonii.AAC.1